MNTFCMEIGSFIDPGSKRGGKAAINIPGLGMVIEDYYDKARGFSTVTLSRESMIKLRDYLNFELREFIK